MRTQLQTSHTKRHPSRTLWAQDCEPVAPPLSVQFALAPPSVARSFASAIGAPVHDPAKWPAYSVSQFSDSKVCAGSRMADASSLICIHGPCDFGSTHARHTAAYGLVMRLTNICRQQSFV